MDWQGWNDENSALALKLYVTEGQSSGEVAKVIGCSRHAVVGRMRRFKATHKPGTVLRPKELEKILKSAPPRAKAMVKEAPKAESPKKGTRYMPKPIQQVFPALPGSQPKKLLELTHGCRFPLTNPGPGRMDETEFCAMKTGGRPYCPTHHNIVYEENKRQPMRAPRQ